MPDPGVQRASFSEFMNAMGTEAVAGGKRTGLSAWGVRVRVNDAGPNASARILSSAMP
ncbi:hypothetical protein D3C72_1976440 [compost metagenome]